MLTYDKLFIGGEWAAPSSPELLDIVSPHDHSVLGRAAQAQTRTSTARWPRPARPSTTGRGRGPPRRADRADPPPRPAPRRPADEIAALITAEIGSAIWFARAGQHGMDRQVGAYVKAARSSTGS